MATVRIDLDQAAAVLGRVTTLITDKLSVTLRNLVAKRLKVIAIRRSPVGFPSVATGKKGTKHPGQFRAGHILSEGEPVYEDLPDLPSYPVQGPVDVEAEVSRFQTPQLPIFMANAVADDDRDSGYSASLEAGRRYNEALGRMLGSEAAPEGIYGPSIEELQGDRATIERQAIEAIEAML